MPRRVASRACIVRRRDDLGLIDVSGLNKKTFDGDNARNTRGDLDPRRRLSSLGGSWDEYHTEQIYHGARR